MARSVLGSASYSAGPVWPARQPTRAPHEQMCLVVRGSEQHAEFEAADRTKPFDPRATWDTGAGAANAVAPHLADLLAPATGTAVDVDRQVGRRHDDSAPRVGLERGKQALAA